jgi:hypothetical protein
MSIRITIDMDSVEFTHVIQSQDIVGFPIFSNNKVIGKIINYYVAGENTYITIELDPNFIHFLFKNNKSFELKTNSTMDKIEFRNNCNVCKRGQYK